MQNSRREFAFRALALGAGALGLTGLSGLTSLGGQAWAQGGPPVEGAQFVRLKAPQPTSTPGKVEVLEFFTYACPHCYEFEPDLEPWVKKLPADVVFRRVPVPFLTSADNLMRSYYAFETMGIVDVMTPKMFQAMNVDRLQLAKPEDVAALVTKSGADGAKFLEAVKSFTVANDVLKAKKIFNDFGIDGTPTLAIQGRYLTSPAQAGGQRQALTVADFLIDRSRKG